MPVENELKPKKQLLFLIMKYKNPYSIGEIPI